jgi:hypothetical protein
MAGGDYAWGVQLFYGIVDRDLKTHNHVVRAVRGDRLMLHEQPLRRKRAHIHVDDRLCNVLPERRRDHSAWAADLWTQLGVRPEEPLLVMNPVNLVWRNWRHLPSLKLISKTS